MIKPVYLGFSIPESSKILMYKFCFDYLKPKHGQKLNLCDMDADSFVLCLKIDYIYKDIAEDIETRFDTSNYKLDRPLSIAEKNNWMNEK